MIGAGVSEVSKGESSKVAEPDEGDDFSGDYESYSGEGAPPQEEYEHLQEEEFGYYEDSSN